MSDPIATYSFLSWLRQGIANKIVSNSISGARATVPVKLKITGVAVNGPELEHELTRNIALYGPGDVIGIDRKAIVKNEPLNLISNFESNYMPYIEFYDEDFPWRYSPSAVNNKRLMPWLALVVLKEDEFKSAKNRQNRPLSFIEVSDASQVFQPFEELWAWAHVHVNESVINDDNNDKIVASTEMDLKNVAHEVEKVLKKNPDLAYSRIMCPRKLEPNSSYHAFLIPAFESGRLSGLGLDPSKTPNAEFSAWKSFDSYDKQDATLFPVYHQWSFKTGSLGDFEYLVRLLKPQPIDSRVGVRDMDVQAPGVNVSGISDTDELGGILKLGGALRIPFNTLGDKDQKDFTKYDTWNQYPYPHVFQEDLASFINLADDYENKTSDQANRDAGILIDSSTNEEDKDPIITAPLYGQWHALVERLLKDKDGNKLPNNANWVHELNLDPRYRVSAGFGTGVIQKNQEDYMESAWKQVGDILEANHRIRLAQLAKETSSIWYHKHLEPMVNNNPEKALLFMAPIHSRVLANSYTVQHTIKESKVPIVITTSAMRRIMRPGSRLMEQLPFDEKINKYNLIDRINKEEIYPAPPKKAPENIPTLQDLYKPDNKFDKYPKVIVDFILKYPWLKWLFFSLFIFFGVLALDSEPMLFIIYATLAFIFAYLYHLFNNNKNKAILADYFDDDNIEPNIVENFHKSPDFVIDSAGLPTKQAYGRTDSEEAEKFKQATRDGFDVIDVSRASGKEKERPPLDVPFLVNTVFANINPEITIPHLIYNIILIPPRIRLQMPEEFVEAMVYPEFDIPMYEPLKKISSDLFLPNINFIVNNSISLLETNQKFIEAYMVGLNHEFARELLWREYPTDQRGSYFRQFWDVSSYLPELKDEELSEEEQKDKLRDIPPLHLWSKYSKLGDHDHREDGGNKEEEVVLVIRGELLKKYPSAVIYAHKAQWHKDKNDKLIFNVERELATINSSETKDIIKTPLYEAKVDPDITFFGFDLTVDEARGRNGDNPSVDKDFPGWFFVIEERPGEPRFGLDLGLAENESIEVWNDLSWDRVAPTEDFLQINKITAINITAIGDESNSEEEGYNEKTTQNKEDIKVKWNKNMNASDLAYILYQVPVMTAIHASEMLPKQ